LRSPQNSDSDAGYFLAGLKLKEGIKLMEEYELGFEVVRVCHMTNPDSFAANFSCLPIVMQLRRLIYELTLADARRGGVASW